MGSGSGEKAAGSGEDEFIENAKKKWKEQDEMGITSVYQRKQNPNAPIVDETLIGERIEFLTLFDIDDDGDETELRWCAGVVERVSDGSWVIPTKSGRGRKCYDVGAAAEILWDAITDAGMNMKACRTIVPLKANKWNKNVEEARRKDIGDHNYGIMD